MDRTSLIKKINDLQRVLSTVRSETRIDLPCIVVVGSQSSGKSSVLEAIVGEDFLPRGTGIVTRRPLVLQLINVGPNDEKYAEFVHMQGTRFTSPAEICREIREETRRHCGETGVSNAEITLTFYSSKVPTLTLIDLPGLTEVAVKGQDAKVVEDIREMVRNYISRPNTIILAVSPANQDLANSHSLNIALEFDEKRERTIGVLTKTDLLAEGNDITSILTNQHYELSYGFFAVKNRSQSDIDNKKPLSVALTEEMNFFRNSPIYSREGIIERCGTQNLANSLHNILFKHILSTIGPVKQMINSQRAINEQRLKQIGGQTTKRPELSDIFNEYLRIYMNLLDGGGSSKTNELEGGAKIFQTFREFIEKIKAFDPVAQMDIEEVKFIISNYSGITVPMYVPHQAFETIVRRAISKLNDEVSGLLNSTRDKIMSIHSSISFDALERYPLIKEFIRNTVEDLLEEVAQPAEEFIRQVIDNEKFFINTSRHDFRGAAVLNQKRGKRGIPAKMDPEKLEEENAKSLLSFASNYFELIKIQVADVIPRAIHSHIIKISSSNGSDNKLYQKLVDARMNMDQETINRLFNEDPRIAYEREKCLGIQRALDEASSIVNNFHI